VVGLGADDLRYEWQPTIAGKMDAYANRSRGRSVCRVAVREFEPDLSSAGAARLWVADHLRRWELSELVGTATLLVNELVSNAVLHAASGPQVVLVVADGVVEVGVGDHEARLPPDFRAGRGGLDDAAKEALMAETGRGLRLVDALADEWGVAQLTAGKQIWFRLTAGTWSHRSACRCHSDDIDRVRLASGRYALAMPGPWDR
jgi:anti-sigma regulatory factor (Ser/Thr protein kinase)